MIPILEMGVPNANGRTNETAFPIGQGLTAQPVLTGIGLLHQASFAQHLADLISGDQDHEEAINRTPDVDAEQLQSALERDHQIECDCQPDTRERSTVRNEPVESSLAEIELHEVVPKSTEKPQPSTSITGMQPIRTSENTPELPSAPELGHASDRIQHQIPQDPFSPALDVHNRATLSAHPGVPDGPEVAPESKVSSPLGLQENAPGMQPQGTKHRRSQNTGTTDSRVEQVSNKAPSHHAPDFELRFFEKDGKFAGASPRIKSHTQPAPAHAFQTARACGQSS